MHCNHREPPWHVILQMKAHETGNHIMLFTSKRTNHLHNLMISITIDDSQIPFKQSVKNLGFPLDCHRSRNAHVSNMLGHATIKFVVCHLFVYSWQVQQQPHFNLLLHCKKMTTLTHCCLVQLMMRHNTCNGHRTMQLEWSSAFQCHVV